MSVYSVVVKFPLFSIQFVIFPDCPKVTCYVSMYWFLRLTILRCYTILFVHVTLQANTRAYLYDCVECIITYQQRIIHIP